MLNYNKMCFTKKIRNNKSKKIKKNHKRVYPEPNPPSFTINEKILCYGCENEFTLDSNQIQIHCAGCHRFFHCKIAGTCYGPNCYTETMRGQKHYLSWCINCVPGIPENKMNLDRTKQCICHKCYTR